MPKVMLEKGFSQMDWLKLVQNNPNINGLDGRPPKDGITMDEVRMHKTREDAWMVFNGMVTASESPSIKTRREIENPSFFFSGVQYHSLPSVPSRRC